MNISETGTLKLAKDLNLVKNPSFETPITGEWVYSASNAAKFENAISYTDWTQTTSSYRIAAKTATSFASSDYAEIAQNVDLTNIKTLSIWMMRLNTLQSIGKTTGANISILIDSTLIWRNDTMNIGETINLDVSAYPGMRTIRFRLYPGSGTSDTTNAPLFRIDNIIAYPLQYQLSGNLTSSIFDAGSSVYWTNMNLSASVPSGTSISVKVRTSETGTTWPAWEYVPVYSSNSPPHQKGRYAQYQATLTTTNPAVTPTLNDVTLMYTPEPRPIEWFQTDWSSGASTEKTNLSYGWKKFNSSFALDWSKVGEVSIGRIKNGGFETGTISDWSVSTDQTWSGEPMTFTNEVVTPGYGGNYKLHVRADAGTYSGRQGTITVSQTLPSLPAYIPTNLTFYVSISRDYCSGNQLCRGSSTISLSYSNGTNSGSIGYTWGMAWSWSTMSNSIPIETLTNNAFNIKDIYSELPADVKTPSNNYVFTSISISTSSTRAIAVSSGPRSYTDGYWDNIALVRVPIQGNIISSVFDSSYENTQWGNVSWSAEVPTYVKNPSFEVDGAGSLNDWTVALCSHVNCRITTKDSWKTDGRFSVEILLLTAGVDSTSSISQTIDMTDIATIKFDAKKAGFSNSRIPKVLIDGVVVWSKTDEGEWINQEIDVSSLSGPHTLTFQMYKGGTDWPETGYISSFYIDNIRAVPALTFQTRTSNDTATGWSDWYRTGRMSRLTIFSDGLAAKNVTFAGNENKTIYIRLLKDAGIKTAKLNLVGHIATVSGSCGAPTCTAPLPAAEESGTWSCSYYVSGDGMGGGCKATSMNIGTISAGTSSCDPACQPGGFDEFYWCSGPSYNCAKGATFTKSLGVSYKYAASNCAGTATICTPDDGSTVQMSWSYNHYPYNVYLDAANSSSPWEWSYTGKFNAATLVGLDPAVINRFLSTCDYTVFNTFEGGDREGWGGGSLATDGVEGSYAIRVGSGGNITKYKVKVLPNTDYTIRFSAMIPGAANCGLCWGATSTTFKVYINNIETYSKTASVCGCNWPRTDSFVWNSRGNTTVDVTIYQSSLGTLQFDNIVTPDHQGRCDVPVLLHSDTEGKIELSNLLIDYADPTYVDPTGSPIISPPGRYIQYRAFLSTQDPTVTPILNDVTITYTPPPPTTMGNSSVINFINATENSTNVNISLSSNFSTLTSQDYTAQVDIKNVSIIGENATISFHTITPITSDAPSQNLIDKSTTTTQILNQNSAFRFTLDVAQKITGVKVISSSTFKYDVLVSLDDITYTKVASGTITPGSNDITFPVTTAKYIKLMNTEIFAVTLNETSIISGFESSGYLATKIIDGGVNGTFWNKLVANETLPANTTITFEVRASDNPFGITATDPPWILVGNVTVLPDNIKGRYFQWRATLNTTDPFVSPILRDVTVGYIDFSNIGLYQNYTLTVAAGNALLEFMNFKAGDANFSKIFNTSTNETKISGFGLAKFYSFISRIGTRTKDFVWVDVNDFVPQGSYSAKITLPSVYDNVYWCKEPKNDPSCSVLKNSTISLACATPINPPCYRVEGSKTAIYLSSFSGGGGGDDVSPPVITFNDPSNNTIFNKGTTFFILSLFTDEPAQCRYNTTAGQAFADMTMFDFTSTETQSTQTHNTLMTGLENGKNYTYYIKCKDLSPQQNVMTTDYVLSYSVAAALLPTYAGPISVKFIIPDPTITVQVGTLSNLLVKVRNPTMNRTEIPLHIGAVSELKNWIWFSGHQYDKERRDLNITLDSGDELSVGIILMAGRVGSYDLLVGNASNMTEIFDSKTFNIVPATSGWFGTAPDLSWLGFVLIIFLALVVSRKKLY